MQLLIVFLWVMILKLIVMKTSNLYWRLRYSQTNKYTTITNKVYLAAPTYVLATNLPSLLLNEQLYNIHLECANYWQDTWLCVQTSLNQKINSLNDVLYNRLNKKLDNLRNTKCKQTQEHQNSNVQTSKPLYTRVKNLSNTSFRKNWPLKMAN
jgi:hypothetical protein